MKRINCSIKALALAFFILFIQTSCSKDESVPNQVENPEEEVDYGNIDDLMQHAGGNSKSFNTPMGIHYEYLKATTADDKVWLENPNNEPTVPKGMVGNFDLKAFPVTLYPFGNPSPSDCNQRSMGDCSAISVFASLAYINPEYIKSIISSNSDGSFKVRMFDPAGKEIYVSVSNKFLSPINETGLAAVSGKKGQATWATILEKALMKYIDRYKLVETIEGIGSETASPAFTGEGESYAFWPERLTAAELKRAVEVSLAEGKIVIGGFNKGDIKIGQSKTVTAHAWTFIYAPKSQVNGYEPMFVMRNPWGSDNGTDLDGLMFIPKDETIADMIDLRIILAGKAKPSKVPTTFTPPRY